MGEQADLADLLVGSVHATDTAMAIADATRPDLPLVYVNPAFERLTGYRSADVLGRNARFMQGPETDPAAVRAMGDSLRRGRVTRSRVVNYRADGSAYWVDLHISPVPDGAGGVARFFAVLHDVTPEVSAQHEAVRAAHRDPLTGLMNRRAFADQLERQLDRAARTGGALGVLFFDVDDFKAVNDAHGHLVGDGYLVHISECLRARLRSHDAAARVGGDEFVALLTDLPGDGAAAVARVVADLRACLATPFTVDGAEHRTSVSVGTALSPRDGTTVRDLIARADADMYRHKPSRPARG
ncbi:diguanylate cyclase domain-containing protein [uncultured Cellulomonas sp.]|uniref:diguanylate cyclase domain-containing protein n=1 Tax=uncultured Cellulomonas sp. TaxID=189682 RepID=UPI00262DAF1E|nr:diguanylate cyclase [uncultured Cellulomonas sp.]